MSYESKQKTMVNNEKFQPRETVKDVSKFPTNGFPERGVRVGYDETDGGEG